MRLLLLNGPNLNLLGEREPEIYGTATLSDIESSVRKAAIPSGTEVVAFQSNSEGALIDTLHAHRHEVDGVIFNPGAYTHYSYALLDAIAAIKPPVVEVHLSDITKREGFRATSVVAPACIATVMGKGIDGYREAVAILVAHLGGEPERG